MTTTTSNPVGPTDWTLCVSEDGTAPGQVLPCLWDATTSGNGDGCSFTLDEPGGTPHYVTDVLADGSVLTSDVSCAPYSGDEGFTSQVGSVVPDQSNPVGLAHTGIDSTGLVVAFTLVVVGIGALVARRLA